MMAKIKITLLLAALAVAGWRPLLEKKNEAVRSLVAIAANAIVLEQSTFHRVDTVAARRVPEVVRAKEECTCRRVSEPLPHIPMTVSLGS